MYTQTTDIESLEHELAEVRRELASQPMVNCLLNDDDEDRYQDNLELSWYKKELADRIVSLESQIESLRPTIPIKIERTAYPNVMRRS